MNGEELKDWHSDPWDQRVLVLSGTGVYHHKVNGIEQPGLDVGGTGEPLAVFVEASTEHYWEADQGQTLRLLVVPETAYPIRTVEVLP